MKSQYEQILFENSKRLRKQMTKEEKRLWYDFLKKLPISVNRQKVFNPYIVDFYIAKEKIIIELDGVQHGEPEQALYDQKRDEFFLKRGYRVLRYHNRDIRENFKFVCQDILNYLNSKEDDFTESK